MSEPRLEDISDYDTLKGQKRKVIYAVIVACLTIGLIYVIAASYYDNSDESLSEDKSYKVVPMKWYCPYFASITRNLIKVNIC